MNADNYVLSGEKTEKVLKRMEKEGYIVKVRERDGGGEESVDYVVGPRGKAEVSEVGVAGCVRKVFGKTGMEREELERRLVRSLGEGVEMKHQQDEEGEAEAGDQANGNELMENGGDGEGQPHGTAAGRRSTKGAKNTPRRGRSSLVHEEAEGDEDEMEEEEDEENESESDV